MDHNKHIVFINNNIDSAAAFLILKWITGRTDLISKTVTKKSFRYIFNRWSQTNNLDSYKRIYILNLDVTDFIDILPAHKLVIIDNNPLHEKQQYKSGTTTLIHNRSSCTDLVYELFSSRFDSNLTKQQKVLMLLVNDHASYSFGLKGSYELGLIFSNYQGDKAQQFCREFYTGFNGFTSQHKSTINFYKDKLANIKRDLEVFSNKIQLGGKKQTIVAAFANNFINEISDWLIYKYQGDISIVVNVDESRVSFRRSKTCNVDVSKLAKKLANGGGHEYSAGGYITDMVLSFSKALKLVK